MILLQNRKMVHYYKLANQKILQKTANMEEDIFYLRSRTLKSPCISMMGIDKLHKVIKYPINEASVVDIVHNLFNLLNMPISWILSIDQQPDINKKNRIPSEVHIQLIADNIKLLVYKTIKNHLKESKQKLTQIKLFIPQ